MVRYLPLESLLSAYRSSNESWEEAKMFITQSADPLLQYFGCSVYEDWIASRWKLVPDANKAELGQFLFDVIISQHKVRSRQTGTILLRTELQKALFPSANLSRLFFP